MADNLLFGDVTIAQISAFRTALMRRMLFEPVTDPGFERETAKLLALVQESENFNERLASTVSKLQDLSRELQNASGRLKRAEDRIQIIDAEWCVSPSPEEMTRRSLQIKLAPPEVQMKLMDLYHTHQMLSIDAMGIRATAARLPFWFGIVDFGAKIAEVRALELQFLLMMLAKSVAAGTEQVFHSKQVPVNVEDLLEKARDVILDKTDIPNFSPVVHVVKAMLDYIRRSEKHADDIERDWDRTEKSFFLFIYYHWWSEADGRDVVANLVSGTEALVPSSRQRFDEARKSLEELTERVKAFDKREVAYKASLAEEAFG